MRDSCYYDLDKREKEADTLAKELIHLESINHDNLYDLQDLFSDFTTYLENKLEDWEFSVSLDAYDREIEDGLWKTLIKAKEMQKKLNAIKII